MRTLASQYKSSFPFEWDPRWNDLRRIGNSPIARASIAVPVLGYLILFHSDLIGYLKIHSSFCHDCTVPWRIYFVYFACCSFAVGSVIYAIRCPQTIKLYSVARDYFETEKSYYCNAANLGYLFELFDKANADPSDPSGLRTRAQQHQNLTLEETPKLAGLMGQFYFTENRTFFWTRILVFFSYALGFVLLAIPTIITFGQVLYRVIVGALGS